MGLMQIMPETWAILRAHSGLGANPYDPHDNIRACAAYLRELHDRYGTPVSLPRITQDWRATKIIWRAVYDCLSRRAPPSPCSRR
jgi:hypothetical protein